MSMSTSGVPRPSLGRIAKKASPAAGAAPDDTETEVAETPTDKAPVRGGTARGAKSAGSRTPAKTGGTPARNGGTPARPAAKTTPATKTTPAAKVTPAKAAKITPQVENELDDEDEALDS